MTNIEFLRDKLDIDFNEITFNFILDLPFEIQIQTFIDNSDKNTNHISQYFSVGSEIEFHGEDVNLESINSDSLHIYIHSTGETKEIPATEALIQNGFLKIGEKYDFDDTINSESKLYNDILERIEREINSSFLDRELYLENNINYGIHYVVDNINRYMLKNLREEISNEI